MPKLGRRSEATELDYLKSVALTTRDAPFGTSDTPGYRPKLIGGNMVNVYERPPETMNLPRYERINFVSDKPNNMDPRAVMDFNRRYNAPYQQEHTGTGQQYQNNTQQEDPFNKRQSRPAYPTKRPDSKDISSRYPTLAPIDKNRYVNHIASTVFEPEAWTKPYNSNVAPNDDLRASYNRSVQNGYSNSPTHNYDQRHYQPPSTSSSSLNDTDEQFRSRLMAMIPRGVFLPENPISLLKKDEMRLINILGSELYYADPIKLRDVYLDISNTSDKQLSGYCQYQDLFHSLSRQSFTFPPDLLQLVASMFVSDHRNQRDVNYEKFLSFVGVALKNRNQIPPNNKPQQQYYNTKSQGKHVAARHRIGSPFFNDGGEAKLLRMIEEQLNENEYIIDFERLVHSFQREDRDMRGTLSADQVKSICFQHRIPIQESLIMGLLQRCDDNNRDEQYNWRAFVEFLERVQPLKTGLPIPASKRPLEYAKTLPEPNASWPKGDLQMPSYNDGQGSWNLFSPLSKQRDEPDANRVIISRMDEQLKDLQRNYEKLNKSSRQSTEAPWFKNFMQFADALYRQDEKYEGSLPYSDVAEWTKMYNNAYNLDIPSDIISTALNQSTKGGKVDIHKYLTLLGKQN